jgi:CheY-like chemotaxis protein
MGKKILLADDSITIQKVIELTFSDEDFDVITVGNGRLAIERIQEVQPDIVLCDIIMPEKDGYEVCEYVKQNPAFAHVPVLLLTGAFEPFDQERAARVGSDGYLAKPFEPQTLISKVKELLSRGPRAAVVPAPQIQAPPPVPSSPPPLPPARPAPLPAPTPLVQEPEVSFIPEEPFEETQAAGAYEPAIEFTAESVPPETSAASSEGYYVSAPDSSGGPELVAVEDESVGYAATPSVYGADEAIEIDRGDAVPPVAGGSWSPPTVEVSWEDRAHAAAETAEAPVFEEVFEEREVEAPAMPSTAAREPESLPPGLLEYEPSAPSPFEAFEAQLRPAAPTPAPATPASQPGPAAPARQSSAADFFAEQMAEFEAEPAPPTVPKAPVAPPAPAVARPAAPVPPTPAPKASVVSFADIAPPTADAAAPPSLAAEVPVPMEMVAQIAQRVVGQVSEKIIREVAWEILPDLAEALIKKEIERITAELKEP